MHCCNHDSVQTSLPAYQPSKSVPLNLMSDRKRHQTENPENSLSVASSEGNKRDQSLVYVLSRGDHCCCNNAEPSFLST